MNIDRMTLNESGATLNAYDPPSNFDFGTAFRVLRRRARLILKITAVFLALGFLAALVTSKTYETSTSILLEAPTLSPFGRDQVYTGTRFDNVTIESQMQVIRSPLLLSQVVDTLDLDSRPTFWAPERNAVGQTLADGKSAIMGTAKGVVRQVMGSEEAAPATDAERFRQAVDKLRDDVTVTRNGVTSVLAVKVSANSPELAAEIANAVAQSYVMQRYDMRRASAETAADWFENRMQELSEQAADAESALTAASGLGTAQTDPGAPNAGPRADAVAALREAISARIAALARFDQTSLAMRSLNPLGVLPAQSASPAFAELSAAYAATLDQEERDALNAQAKALLPDLLTQAQTALDTATANEAAARAELDEFTPTRGATSGDLGRLESEARIYREMYENYTTTYLKTKEQQTFPMVDASILGVAQPPEGASGRSGSQLLLIAGLLGLTVGTGAAFAREQGDRSLRTRAALARAVGGPVLGLLPPPREGRGFESLAQTRKLPEIGLLKPRIEDMTSGGEASKEPGTNIVPLPKHRLALGKLRGPMSMTLTQPLSPYSDTVRRIRVAFDTHFAPRHKKRGSVIGFLSDDGTQTRSTLAMNYAEMTAVGGKKTLLIDFDWLEAFLSRTITPAASFGITDLMYSMSPNFSPTDVYWVDERTGLYFLPNRAVGKNEPVDPATFDTALLTMLVATLSRDFDQIVIDFPSLGDSVDAAALATVMDGFVCAADWGICDRKALARHMATSGIPVDKIVGAVLAGATEADLARYESAS